MNKELKDALTYGLSVAVGFIIYELLTKGKLDIQRPLVIGLIAIGLMYAYKRFRKK